jgi:hypothetical protein
MEDCMRKRQALFCLVAAVIVGPALMHALVVPSETIDAAAAFERLKSLQGSWEATGKDGARAKTRFDLVANGSVLLEQYSNAAMPGGGHMITAYHLDGADLILTHYCIARNQPTLRAGRFDTGTAEIQFEFLRATNLARPGAGHMRRAKYRVEDADHFTTEWEFFENGTKKMTEVERFTRIR